MVASRESLFRITKSERRRSVSVPTTACCTHSMRRFRRRPLCSVDVARRHLVGERWAYVPFSVYNKLAYLSAVTNFSFRPTVDGTPVTRDVFFSGSVNKSWQHHRPWEDCALVVVALYHDIADAAASEAGAKTKVLWEFSNTTADNAGKNLGYTYGQAEHRSSSRCGKWVVLVPSGYFPKTRRRRRSTRASRR